MLNQDFRRSCWSLSGLFLLGQIGWIAGQTAQDTCNLGSLLETGGRIAQYLVQNAAQPGYFYGNSTQFFQAQFYHATLKQTLPAFQLLNLGPAKEHYEIRLCAPEDVHKCMTYGSKLDKVSSLPRELDASGKSAAVAEDPQFKISRITWPEVLFSAAGDWYPDKRLLRIPTYLDRTWGFEPTSSVREGCWYTESGAAHANSFMSLLAVMEIYFNQDMTKGQVLATASPPYAMGRQLVLPPVMANWTLEALPNNQWRRRSWVFVTTDIKAGDYIWKQIVDGNGQPGPYYNEWVAARAGKPFSYVVRAGEP